MKPIYTHDFQFDADTRIKIDGGHISLDAFINWAKEQDSEEDEFQKALNAVYRPKKRNFIFNLLRI